MTRILVIDGNEAATRARHVSVGGTDSGDGYAATLKRLHPDLECDIVRPADEEPKLPAGVAIDDYDGAVITGSALNIYSREAAVERQIDLAKAVFAAGVPCFGSCWGLQVGVTAAGGQVIRNPRGREFGFGRRIQLTPEGRDHDMFRGKPDVFEAVTVHVDTVATLPAHATPLAHNDMGLQAAVFPTARDRLNYPEMEQQGLLPHNVKQVYLAGANQPNVKVDVTGTLERSA